jgi:hypothetical protein
MLALAAAFVVAASSRPEWRSLLRLDSAPSSSTSSSGVTDGALPLPRRGEVALARARALQAGGHLSDALAALELVRPTDPQKADAERLRGDIQRQLIGVSASVPGGLIATGDGKETPRRP